MNRKHAAHLSLAALGIAGLALAAPRPADATTAFNIGTPNSAFNGNFFGGFTFTVGAGSPIEVTALGYYTNALGFGLTATGASDTTATSSTSHIVELFNQTTGTEVASTSVSPTSAGGTDAYFTYNNLTAPVELLPGTYDLLANTNGGGAVNATSGVTSAAGSGLKWTGFTYSAAVSTPPSTLPTQSAGAYTYAFFGPNFQYTTVSAAPEPSQVGMIALMGLGLGALMLRARRSPALSSASRIR